MSGLLPDKNPSKRIPFLGIHKAMTILDVVLACAYAYYMFKEPIVNDDEYDSLRQQARSVSPRSYFSLMARPAYQYPNRIRDLAWYLWHRSQKRQASLAEREE